MAKTIAQPNFADVMSYKGVYLLNDVSKKGRGYKLRATHYAVCLLFGPNPIWGVWTIRGTFIRFFPGKESIREAYPNKAWNRKMATWMMDGINVERQTREDRAEELSQFYHKRMPK